MNLTEIRKKIAKKVLDFIKSTNLYLVLKTFTGSGKTTTALKAIDEAGLRYIYAAPSHDIIIENIGTSTLRNFDYLHLEGKDRCCLRTDLKDLIRKGIDITGFCDECGFRQSTCEYERNIREAYSNMPNLAITHSHIQSWLPNFLNTVIGENTISDYYDVLIVDENPIKCFIHEMSVTLQDLVLLREICMRIHMKPTVIRLIEALIFSPLDYSVINDIPLVELNKYSINKKFSQSLAELYRSGELTQLPRNIIPFLFEIFERKAEYPLNRMIYYRDSILNLCYFKPNALNLNLKVLGLDGTASKPVWDQMLGDDVEVFPIDYQYENAYQLNGGRYPIMSWRYKGDIPATLCALIDDIASTKKRNVLIVGTKFVNRKIARLLKTKNHVFAVYYNLRSKNEYYMKCDTVILACEVNPPPEKIAACVELSGWDSDLWRHIYREEEMQQAMGRLRQNILIIERQEGDDIVREKMEVFILPSTGVVKNEHYSNLLPECQVLSKQNLNVMLGTGGYFDELQLYQNLILMECPTNINKISKKYNLSYNKVKKYFSYLVKNNFIEQIKRGEYRITEKGITKTPVGFKQSKITEKTFFTTEP